MYQPGVVQQQGCGVARHDGLRRVDVYVKGPGSGRESAIRALQSVGVEVSLIKDVTQIIYQIAVTTGVALTLK